MNLGVFVVDMPEGGVSPEMLEMTRKITEFAHSILPEGTEWTFAIGRRINNTVPVMESDDEWVKVHGDGAIVTSQVSKHQITG